VVRVSATGDQQQRIAAKRLNGLNGKSQSLPFPAGAHKQNAKSPFRHFQAPPGFRAGDSWKTGSNSIGHDVDSFRWKIVPMDDFLGNHARVCDHPSYGLENLAFQREKCRVFHIEEPQAAPPTGFKARSSLQPCSVNTVSCTKNVATRNTIEAEHCLPRFARPLKGSGKFQRLVGIQADEVAKRPAIFRPVVGRIKGRSVAARTQAGCETEQVGFSPTACGISPADETDVGRAGGFNHCERNLLC
jgi:hypothetical protein